jgi:hypothetical protein
MQVGSWHIKAGIAAAEKCIAVVDEAGMADDQAAGHLHSKQYHWLLQQWQAQRRA